MREKENLTLLGNQQTEYSMDYNPSVLEAFQNKHPENDYFGIKLIKNEKICSI